MAPEFINGFLGFPKSVSNYKKELNRFPEGSTSTLSHNFSPSSL